MKSFSLIIAISLVGAVFAMGAETVYLKNGKFQKGSVVSQTKTNLRFKFVKSGSTTETEVTIPWNSIQKIEFPQTGPFQSALDDSSKTTLLELGKLWGEHEEWIGRPESPVAQLGLVYAQRLSEAEEEMAPEQAIDLYDEIAKKAWREEDQAEAIRGKLKTLLKMGKERDALRMAEAIAAESENPSHLLEARQILAENAFEKLKALEEENPRWRLDDEIRPQRNVIFNQAIDQSLFAFLFYGTQEEAAVRGLIHAAEVYEFGKEYQNAKNCAGDVLRLYPDSSLKNRAKELFEKRPNLKKAE